MTPERAKWWDSLPTEEKRVRMNIKNLRKPIKAAKKALRVYHELNDCLYKEIICENKQIIQALRKQIAMRPWERKDVHSLHCPRCRGWIYSNDYKHPYCDLCGQKLRWE